MMLRRGSGAMAAPQPIERAPLSPRRVSAGNAHVSRLNEDHDDHDADASLIQQVHELATARPEEAARVLREWIYQG